MADKQEPQGDALPPPAASQSPQPQQGQYTNYQGYSKGGYNKNYNAANPNGNRQNYLNPNKQYFNNSGNAANANSTGGKRNYSQKINNQSPQYNAYAYPNMYPASYYNPYYYPQMPGVNMPPAYNTQLPQSAQSPVYPAVTSPAAGKVRITDKEGKLVELERGSASTLALTTPVAASSQLTAPAASSESASPSPAAAAPTFASSPVADSAKPAVARAPKTSAAEEFRRKILEKAKLALLKKEQDKLATETPKAEPTEAPKPVVAEVAKEAPKVEASEPKQEVVVEAPKEEPKQEITETPEPKEVPQPKEVTPEAPKETVPEITKEVTPEAPKAEEKETTPASKEVEPVVQEPVVEEPVVEEPTAPVEPELREPVEPQTVDAPQDVSTPEPLEQREPVEPADEETEIRADNEEDDEEDEEEVDENVFDLSKYFDRLENVAGPIEDPFAFTYPYPYTGVDVRWKAGLKHYRYDPQFLLQFREAVTYPIDDEWKEKLEGLGIVSNKRSGSGPQRMNSNRLNNQVPGRFNGAQSGNRPGQYEGRQNSRNGSRRRGGSNVGGAGPRDRSTRNRNQSKRGPREGGADDQITIPADEIKPLVASANRWVPRSKQKTEEVKLAPDGSVLLGPEDIERKVNSSLNKLTLEMFEPITEDLLAIAKQSIWEEDAKTTKQVISLTFAKACDEPYWSTVYAQFCAKMLKVIPEEIKDVNVLTKNGEPATGGDLARRILLATCQSEYEKGWVDKLPTNEDGSPLEPEMMSDEYYKMAAAKRRGLGLVKFIGNLYILNMLNDQVILHCLRDQSKNIVDPSEDSLENLAQLINTVGPRFETSDRNKAALNMIFDNVSQILENCKLPSRIRFMLMDLQDLRNRNWKSLTPESGPKTIKEIHNEAELKRIEDSRALAEKRRQNKSSFNSGGYGGGDSRSNSTRGGSSWGNKKEARAPAKDSRGFTAVPRSQSNRPTPDSSFTTTHMSPRENSKRTDSMASNIFAALDDNDDNEAGAAGP